MRQGLKFLLDENIGFKVYRELQSRGYHVQSVIVEHRGASDEEVVETAISRGKIIVTMDKDFGYLAKRISRLGNSHSKAKGSKDTQQDQGF